MTVLFVKVPLCSLVYLFVSLTLTNKQRGSALGTFCPFLHSLPAGAWGRWLLSEAAFLSPVMVFLDDRNDYYQ